MRESGLNAEELNNILQCVGEGIIYQESNGMIRFFNPTAQRIFGITEDEARTRSSMHPEWKLVYEDGSPCPGDEHPSMITLRTGRPLTAQVRGIDYPGRPVTWLSINTRPVFLQSQQDMPEAVVISFSDITEEKRAESEKESVLKRLQAMWSLAELQDADIKTISDHVLVWLTRMTESDYGFFGFLNEDETVMSIHSWSGKAMEGCYQADKPAHFPIDRAGIWAEAIRQRKPLVVNDYAAYHPSKKGFPSGHVELTNLLVVPHFSHDKIVSVAAVANRKKPYGDQDIVQITSFLQSVYLILERKQAEEELLRNRDRYSSLFNQAPIAIWEEDFSALKMEIERLRPVINDNIDEYLNRNPKEVTRLASLVKILEVNRTSLDVFGVSSREELDFNLLRYFSEESLEVFRREVVALANGELQFASEISIIDLEGRERYLDLRLSVCPGCENSLSRVLVSFIDITERKNTEESLRESEERFRKYYELGLIGMAITSPEKGWVQVNDRLCEILGYPREELTKLTWIELTHPEDLPADEAYFNSVIVGDRDSYAMDKRYIRKDGQIVHANISVACIRKDDGSVDHFVALVRDITDRKVAETALKNSESLLRNIIDSSPDYIYVKDRDLKTMVCNKMFAKAVGKEPSELVGRTDIENGWNPEFVKGNPAKGIRGFEQDDKTALAGEVVNIEGEVGIVKTDVRIFDTVKLPLRDSDGSIFGVLGISRDVTAERRAVGALRESEERFRKILEDTQAGYFFLDTQGKFQHVNRAWLDMHSYQDSAEVIGRHFSVTQVESDLEGAQKIVEQVVGKQENIAGEFSRQRKDGSVGYHTFSIRPVQKDGVVAGLEGFLIDTTQLREAQKNYQTLFNSMLDAFALHEIICDQSGAPVDYRFLAVNPAFERMTGLKEKDLLGKTVRKILPGIEQHWIETYGHVALNGEPVYFENYSQDLCKYYEVTAFRPSPGQFACIFNDTTEHKQAEEALRRSEERNRQIIHSAIDGFWRVDAQTRLIEVNEAYCRMSGYSREELLTMSVRDLDALESPDEVAARTRRIIQNGSDRFSSSHRRKNGSTFDVEASIQYRSGEDGGEFAVFLRDVTEQRRLESQLRQAQKMEAIGTLAGGIAHDFNNILGAVLGFSEIAHEDAVSGRANPKDIQQIMKAALRAKELVKQILTFSRKNEAALQPLSVSQACLKAGKILEHTIPKMISIKCDLSEDLPHVLADPTQMEQILLNLCSNAADAMPDGGELILATKALSAGEGFYRLHPEVPLGKYVLLSVSDTGCGMDQITREHIFEPFYTTKGVGKGTGLGLSTVYGIVKTHNGFIYCDSEPGMGTTFTIYLPAINQDQPEGLAESSGCGVPIRGGAETIILADDEEPLRKIGTLMLKRAGYRVLEVSTGEEAVKIFFEQPNPPDLLITDLGMPGMGGHKAMQEILARFPAAKIIIASGYAANDKIKASLNAGAAAYVAKPFAKNDLLATVRNVLDAPQPHEK